MQSPAVRLHRILLRRSFYSLLLGTMLGTTFLFARILIAHQRHFGFFIWNLFLAWVPYGFSVIAEYLHESGSRNRRLITMIWLAWLAMLPNAPYILTDFVHVRGASPPVPWWYDLGLWMTFALVGCFLGIVSLRVMHDLVRPHIGEIGGWLFVMFVSALTGFGIYLGRFERWNSWDLLTHPHVIGAQIARGMVDPLDHPRAVGVTIMFGALVLITYVLFATAAMRRQSVE
jgi:uncharacterized membrane protein